MFKKFVVVISIVLTIALCCVGLIGCNAGKNVEENEVDEIFNNFDVVIDDNSNVENTFEGTMIEPAIRLSSGTSVASANGVSKTLTATVYPEDATNVEVDWSIAWESGSLINEDISNYLLFEVAEDGSRVCTVTCIKGFEGSSAKVTVTTRDGGFKASCLCTYVGAPSYMGIQMNGQTDGTIDTFSVTSGTYNGSLYLKNELGTSIDGSNAIGSSYGDYEITSIYADLKYYVTVIGVNNGTIVHEEDVLVSLSQSSPTFNITRTHDNVTADLNLTINRETFANASISGNVLTTNIVKTQGSVLAGQGVATRTGWRVEYKGAYYPEQGGGQAYPCMIRIALNEKVSGVEKLVTFNMVTSASSVSLEPSSLEF
ncbi:MAG: hypothetical protein IKB56_07435 [Clostridia bacterium]|nr:hypothetical protein [Clostridia bacterium]